MTLRLFLWGFVLTAILIALFDLAHSVVRHYIWRYRWKHDSMAAYRRYMDGLERATQAKPRQHRRSRTRQRR